MEIEIPSPSVILGPSPVRVVNATPIAATKKKVTKPRGAPKPKSNGITKDTSNAVTKPKQSKSRNGCMTCKKKRLKCDETKPSCVQCQKRNVVCEGYKKDFKWRTFEETTFNNKVASKKKASGTTEEGLKKSKIPDETPWSLQNAFASASSALHAQTAPVVVSPSASVEPVSMPELDPNWSPPKFDLPSPSSTFDINTTPTQQNGSIRSPSFTGSPTLLDLLLPGTDMNQPPDMSEERPPMSPTPYQPGPFLDHMPTDDEADEEIVRDPMLWRGQSPALSDCSSVSSRSSELTILVNPRLDAASPEMLLLRFDRNTCGILSVKDGPNENPWRSLIWPLAQDSPALYHAISSMTAFHGAQDNPQLRLVGVAHMHKSIKRLAADIENMRLEPALATSLALAFGEGWDEKTSTGIQHVLGAKIMVSSALVKHRQNSELGMLAPDDALRLRFLCNTFIYLDVIARLTSSEESHDLNFEDILTAVNPPTPLLEVDPLMGCATTLFPIIGRVASLAQTVRKCKEETNSLNIISQANELQEQLMQWQTPDSFNFVRPEDPTSEVEHSIRTAEAYRIATLLYLHQAVPEIPSGRHEAMAKRVLLLLASVPLSSRTIIVQIFPLFAASCEVTNQEDRAWVIERWLAMMARLTIGNVDSCWKVVQEIWHRRDAYQAEKAQRMMRLPNVPRRSTMTDIPLDQIDHEYTVRGKLHWRGVMSDWQWEVFLG